ncbi:hypothetical protein EHQ96_16785 [Leptospira levettii]|uniref:hypothetical protein n=1 Tax=Leptospira levettii TaxID=2023178 RepID=UPI001083C470|nr:hypothetical protein [Leptospira levettii]TGM43688.1 hypothetical protein EHQ75_05850 [Leptospira levettii]TGM65479.1 hypothetical protein EHQ96_16785 [Leptospira levettii]
MKSKIVIILFIIFNVSCVHWGDYRDLRLDPQIVTSEDVLVKGSSCSILLVPPVPRLDVAIKNALEKSPGKRGIKNPIITDEYFFFIRCMTVEGYATETF